MRGISLLVTGLFVALTFSGCLSADDGAGDATDTPDEGFEASALSATGHPVWVLDGNGTVLGAEAFGDELPGFEQRFITDRRSGEPTVGVTSSGAVFYAAIEFDAINAAGQATLPRTFYFRSYDAGETWTDVTPDFGGEVPTHPESGDPYVHVDPDTDRVFAMDMTPSVACNKVSYSDDDGDSWVLANPAACPLPGSDHPTLFTGPKVHPAANPVQDSLYPNTVYLCSNQVAQAKCAYSLDGGHTWLTAPAVFPGVDPIEADPELNNLCSGFTSHGTTDRNDGTVYVPRSLCGRPALAISYDGGLSYEWDYLFPDEPRYETEPGVHDTMVAVDESGTLYYFWLGNGGTTANLVISEDQGETWSDVLNVTAPGVTAAKFPSIAAGADGRIAFQYVATTNPRGHAVGDDIADNETNRAIWENATWDAYVGVSIDADSEEPVFAVTTVNDPRDPLKRGECVDRCHGDDGGMYDFLDLEVDPVTGRIYTALVDVCNDACETDPDATAEYYQRATGDLGVQVAGPTLWNGTEADR